MKHPLLAAFGLAARSIDAWKRLGITEEQQKHYAFGACRSPDGYQRAAYLTAWGF